MVRNAIVQEGFARLQVQAVSRPAPSHYIKDGTPNLADFRRI